MRHFKQWKGDQAGWEGFTQRTVFAHWCSAPSLRLLFGAIWHGTGQYSITAAWLASCDAPAHTLHCLWELRLTDWRPLDYENYIRMFQSPNSFLHKQQADVLDILSASAHRCSVQCCSVQYRNLAFTHRSIGGTSPFTSAPSSVP